MLKPKVILVTDEENEEKENEIVQEEENGNRETEYLEENDNGIVSNEEIEVSREENRRPQRELKLSTRLNDYELYTAYCLFTSQDPYTYKEAINSGDEWKAAIEKELEAHKKLGTWVEKELPEGKKAIDTKWIFKTKENGIKKARLVAKGFQEQCFSNVYAPVARLSAVRILISVAVQRNWKIRQLDVPTAFLNGILNSEVYIKAPEDLIRGGDRSKTFKLNRALLKESPRCWNENFDEIIRKNKFQRSGNDFCLYFKDKVWLLVYVDDILVTGEDRDVEETINMLKEEFNTKDLGEIKNFVGNINKIF